MALDNFRRITINVDTANDYIAPIMLSSGDANGRTLLVKLTDNGRSLTSADGIVARLTYDDKSGNSGFKTMDFVDGLETAAWECTAPSSILNGSYALLCIQFWQGADVVCTRVFRANVDRSLICLDPGTESGDAVRELYDAIANLNKTITDANNTLTTAVSSANTEVNAAIGRADASTEKATSAASAASENAGKAGSAATAATKAAEQANDVADRAAAATSEAETAAASANDKAEAADSAASAASAAASKAEAAAAGIAESLAKKQDKLIAGDGISISGSTISATASGGQVSQKQIIPLASSVLNPESGDNAVFVIKSSSVCTLVVNGRTGKNGTDLSMDASLIDTDSSTVLNGLLPENYRHDGVLNLGTQNGSSIDRAIITLERNPYNNDKPLAVHDINNNYYNTIKTGTLIAYTFTWAI